MKKNISFQFQSSREDVMELYKHTPYYKAVYRLGMLGNLVALLTFCGYNIMENLKFAADGTDFFLLNFITVVSGLMMYVIIRFLARFLLKKVLENRCNQFLNKNDSTLQIVFNPNANEFSIGKSKTKILVTKSFVVHSTQRNYLFYVGNGRTEKEKFYLPKEGTLEHGLRLKRLIGHLEDSGLRVMQVKE